MNEFWFLSNGTASDTLYFIKHPTKYFSPSISDYTNCMACLEEFDLIDNGNTGFCARKNYLKKKHSCIQLESFP